MRAAALSGALIAAMAASALATPSSAQDYYRYGGYGGYGDYGYGAAPSDPCHQKVHDSGTTGAVLGGLLGAVIGSNMTSHHGSRTGGAAIGAVAGAFLGNSIGRSSAKSSDRCRYAYDDGYGYSSYDTTYGAYDYGYRGDYATRYRDNYRSSRNNWDRRDWDYDGGY